MRELERDLPTTEGAADRPPARLVIVGVGRVGGALARAGLAAGLDVALAGRGETTRASGDAECVLLCVPDGEIGTAAVAVAAADPAPALVGHTSGATTLAALDAAARAGAGTFSLHPLQTIPDAGSDLIGVPAAIAGSGPGALADARALAERLGMRPFEVPEDRRAAYHAAASIASNFLVALEESAAGLLAEAGIDDARELLAPLVLRTAANWSERGAAALTGPIARGDTATVERHLAALRETAPELLPLYEALAERTEAIAGEAR